MMDTEKSEQVKARWCPKISVQGTAGLVILILPFLAFCGEPDIADGIIYQLTDGESWEERR